MSAIQHLYAPASREPRYDSRARYRPVFRWTVPAVCVVGLLLLANVPVTHAFDGTKSGGSSSGNGAGPVITDFVAIDLGDNVWSFEGTVSDPNPSSCTVYFSGLPSLQGKSCSVQSNGNFVFPILLTPADEGEADAQAIDGQGLKSPFADANVDNS